MHAMQEYTSPPFRYGGFWQGNFGHHRTLELARAIAKEAKGRLSISKTWILNVMSSKLVGTSILSMSVIMSNSCE